MRLVRLLPALLAGLFAQQLHAGDDQLERRKELDRQCLEERTARILPIQARLAQECKDSGKEPGWCDRQVRHYGWNKPSLFTDLPSCVEAFELLKQVQP